MVENLPATERDADVDLIRVGIPGGGSSNPLQESCLKNPMDRGAWWATVHGVAKGRTGLSMCTMNPYDSLASVALIGVNIPSERLFL